METVHTELRKRSIFHGSPIKGESTQNLCGIARFGPKGLNLWHPAAQSGLVGSCYDSKKDFQKPARRYG